MHKQLFYFGDLDLLLKQEYFKDKLNYEHFLEFVANFKNTELKTNEVVKLQYQDLSGNHIPVLLSESVVNIDYVIHIDHFDHLTIENHNFTEIECNIKSTSGIFGLVCVSQFIDNIEQLIQDISKEHIGLVFTINDDCLHYGNDLDYQIRTFDIDEETYCHVCNQYEFTNKQQNVDCECCNNNGVVSSHYQISTHEVKLNKKRLFVVSN
jgi:hypothetical protein